MQRSRKIVVLIWLFVCALVVISIQYNSAFSSHGVEITVKEMTNKEPLAQKLDKAAPIQGGKDLTDRSYQAVNEEINDQVGFEDQNLVQKAVGRHALSHRIFDQEVSYHRHSDTQKCNCSENQRTAELNRQALEADKTHKTETSFKKRGILFDCVSQTTLKRYNADAMDRNSRPLTISGRQVEDPAARKSSFKEIFEHQVWGGAENYERDRMSENYQASGPGSKLVNTQGAMALLHSVIEKLKVDLNKDVIRIADIPCGDMQWISHFLKTRKDIDYTGVDIVPELIKRHEITYRRHRNIHFINTDVVQSPLSESYDIIFSRQMMQHFPNTDVQRVLYHFSTSGSKYMIATTYSDIPVNQELSSFSGVRYRQINLEKRPFSLVPPTCTYQETQQTDNYLGMWELPLKVMD